MATAWTIKTEVINTDTDLRKVVATRTGDVTGDLRSFFVKARMLTKEEQDAVWDDIWNQYQASLPKSDAISDAGKTNLEQREMA